MWDFKNLVKMDEKAILNSELDFYLNKKFLNKKFEKYLKNQRNLKIFFYCIPQSSQVQYCKRQLNCYAWLLFYETYLTELY